MPRLTTEQKVERQRIKAAQENAKLRSLAAAQAAERRKTNRNKDTRRKILAGAFFFQWAAQHPTVSNKLKEFIAGLEEERDKEVFADWPIPAPAKTAAPQAPAVSVKTAAQEPGPVVPPAPRSSAPARAGAFDGAKTSPSASTVSAPPAPPSAQSVKVNTTT